MEAIILAGGFGTRLQSVVSDVPKPMAPIGDKPFLHYILTTLYKQDVTHVVLSVGYKHETIVNYFGSEYLGMQIDYAVEDEPLGTGGAIKKALKMIKSNDILVLNGDTFFDIELSDLRHFYEEKAADIAIALKTMRDFDRYGVVEVAKERVTAFREKKPSKEGEINGGIYFLKRNLFDKYSLPDVFSFEEFLEDYMKTLRIFAKPYDSYFIDIGVPDDYSKAIQELK